MSINPVPTPNVARNPRVLIKINDTVFRKITSWTYVENNYYQPDTFRVELPLYTQDAVATIEYWQSQPALLFELFVGFPTNTVTYGVSDLQSLILGGINNIDLYVFDNGRGYISFDGFDLGKKFIDTKTFERFPNLTPSQIATTFANEQGLTPVVTDSGPPYAGYYYTGSYVQMGNAITQWDLLTYLAQQIGYQVFVRGTQLVFQPRPVQSSNPYLIQARTLENGNLASMNGSSLRISRNMNFARDVQVTILSFNSKSGRVSVTAQGRKTKRGVVSAIAKTLGEPQKYVENVPGLSKQQAQMLANQLVLKISQHERIIQVSGPGDNILRKDSVIQLSGVSPSADQTYFPDSITRSMAGVEGAYKMEFVAKNHSPQSIVEA